MKPKVRRKVQPRTTGLRHAQVQQEIRNFFQAVDSYPARAAKEPDVTFQQHLCSISLGDDNCIGNRTGRH